MSKVKTNKSNNKNPVSKNELVIYQPTDLMTIPCTSITIRKPQIGKAIKNKFPSLIKKITNVKQSIKEENDKKTFINTWVELLAQTGLYNKCNETFTFSTIKKTKYGINGRLIAPRGLALASLDKLKPAIETAFNCTFDYNITDNKGIANCDFIETNKLTYNKIPFKPVKTNPYEIYIGVDILGEPIIVNLITFPHVLLAGAQRSGKNGCADHIIPTLIHNNQHHEIEIYLGQGAKNDFIKYMNCRQVYGYADNIEDILEMVRHIKKIMEKNIELMKPMVKTSKGENLYDYNKMHKGHELPYTYLIIDEFLSIMPSSTDSKEKKDMKTEILDILSNIAQYGGALGVFYIISHQKPEKALMPTFLKNMTQTRICFGFKDAVCSQIVLGNDLAVGLPPRRAYVSLNEDCKLMYTTNLKGKILPTISKSVLPKNPHIYSYKKKSEEEKAKKEEVNTIKKNLREQTVVIDKYNGRVIDKKNNTPSQSIDDIDVD